MAWEAWATIKDGFKSAAKTIKWTVDSGATVHCTNDRSLITKVYPNESVRLQVADNRVLHITVIGEAKVKMYTSTGKYRDVVLHNVCYHPEISNLLSVRQMKDQGFRFVFDDQCYFQDKDNNDKFNFKFSNKYEVETAFSTVVNHSLLHSRFGHAGPRRLKKLSTRSTNFPSTNFTSFFHHDPTNCNACNSGGARKKPFPKRTTQKFTYFGQRLSTDLCGPFPKSIMGFTYIMCVVDASTNILWVAFLKSKSSTEVRHAMEQYLKEHSEFFIPGRKITWHTDNGGEFMSDDLDDFCQEFSIHRSFSIPYAPPQNAHAERMWGILLRTSRIILAESGVPTKFWTFAIQHAVNLHNVLPSTVLPQEISPSEALKGVAPNVERFRVWGCKVWHTLEKHELKSKLSPRSVPAIHLGIDPARKGYIIYVPYLNRITSSYHLNFQETEFLSFGSDGEANIPNNVRPLRGIERTYKEKRDREQTDRPPAPPAPSPPPVAPPTDDQPADQQDSNPDVEPERCRHDKCTKPKHPDSEPHSFEDHPGRDQGRNPPRSTRAQQILLIMEDFVHQAMAINPGEIMNGIKVPNAFKEAITSEKAKRWWEAMKTEYESLVGLHTWEPVDRDKVPKGRKVTRSRWVYAIKIHRDGTIERFKARFVVCGYSQVKGYDYTHSFSATLRATSLRLLLAIAAGEKLKLEHFDVSNAFTQSDIDSEIYVEPAKGFETYDKKGNVQVLRLIKSLYGTKQAGRLWQLKLRKFLISIGFSNSTHDPCLFVKRDNNGGVLIIGVYVDDLVVAHNDKMIEWFTKEFTGPKGFKAKRLGKLEWFLGMGITQADDFSITVDQKLYIQKLIDRFVPDFHSKILPSMPCNPNTFPNLTTASDDSEKAKMKSVPYLELTGSLLYLSTMSRSDIAYHMSILCSCMHNPSQEAYDAAIMLLLYVAKTRDYTLHFSGKTSAPKGFDAEHSSSICANHGIIAYSDASWNKTDDLGRNMFGFIVYMFGGPISFTSKRLNVVALSSAEAEYAAAAAVCKELHFIRNVITDLGFTITGPIVVAVDNQAAIQISENVGVTARNKHFKDTIHYFRDRVEHHAVKPVFVTTLDQRADGYTKALEKTASRTWTDMVVNTNNRKAIAKSVARRRYRYRTPV